VTPSPVPQAPSNSWRSLLVAGLGFVVVTVGLVVGINAIGLDRIRSMVESAGPFAPLVFIAVKTLTFVVAPLSSGPMQLSAGILFGLVPGTLYTIIGETLGGSINFFLSRSFGRPVIQRFVGAEGMARVDSFVDQIVDWKTLIYARLFLFSLYDFISYTVGLSRLQYRTYVIISFTVGLFPAAMASLLGSALAENSGSILLVYGVIGVVSIVPLVFQKQIRRFFRLGVKTPAGEQKLPP